MLIRREFREESREFVSHQGLNITGLLVREQLRGKELATHKRPENRGEACDDSEPLLYAGRVLENAREPPRLCLEHRERGVLLIRRNPWQIPQTLHQSDRDRLIIVELSVCTLESSSHELDGGCSGVPVRARGWDGPAD